MTMNAIATEHAYGTLTEPATLTIQRLLPGPVERVWAYLTDSNLRRQWLAAGEMPLEAGAAFQLTWRNDELNDPPSARPADIPAEHSMQSRVIACEPPRKLVIAWQNSGDVSFELAPKGDKVLLTLTHHRLPSRPTLLAVSAGWHTHLDLLVAITTGARPQPFWIEWKRLRNDYDARLPA